MPEVFHRIKAFCNGVRVSNLFGAFFHSAELAALTPWYCSGIKVLALSDHRHRDLRPI
jgi:hypothetical protein